MSAEKVLIVGAGHAAGQVVATLRQRKFDGHITLVGDEASLPYQRPPLSKKYLSGDMDADRLLVRPADFYEDPSISVHLDTRVVALDLDARTAVSADGKTFDYDKLVLATGSRPRRMDVTGDDLAGVHYLRSIADVDAIRTDLVPEARLTIVGGGYIGLEVAAVATAMGVRVTVVEAANRVMSRVVSPIVSRFYQAEHRRHGVEIILSAKVGGFTGKKRVAATRLADGEELRSDVVIIGVGAVPNTELAESAGLEIDNGIVVDERCRSSDRNVYAVGDCTWHPNPLLHRRLRLESVQNALDQAKTAALNICGEDGVYAEVPWFWSDQYDHKLQIAGLSEGYDDTVVRGDPDERAFACYYLHDGRVIAVDAVNSARDFLQAKPLIAANAIVDPARLADPTVAIKDLLPPA